jgi:TolA-binding protein
MDLHPEDLIEREMSGDLSPGERDRLEAHARECTVCKLERLARADFQRDADGPAAEVDVQRLLAAVALPLAIQGTPRMSHRPRLRHMRFVLIAAAVISVSGLAAAARWSGTRALFAIAPPAAAPAVGPVAAAAAAPHRSTLPAPVAVAANVAPPEALEAVAVVSPVVAVVPVAAAVPVGPTARVGGLRTPSQAAPLAAIAQPERARASSPPATEAVAAAPVAEAALDAFTVFRRANAAREMGDHVRAADLYRRLIDDFATSPEARASLAMFGRMLLDDGDASGALQRFDDALRLGTGALREDVMLGRALALQRLGRVDDEAKAWSSLLATYPSSVHADRARRRLRELGRS